MYMYVGVYLLYVHICVVYVQPSHSHLPVPYRVTHPNIVKLKELYDDKTKLYLVMEL